MRHLAYLFFTDADSKVLVTHSKVMTLTFTLLQWHCMRRVSKSFLQEGCHQFHPSPRLPVSFLACPDLFRNLNALHDYRRELVHAPDMVQD